MDKLRITQLSLTSAPLGWYEAKLENRAFGHEQDFGIPAKPPAEYWELTQDITNGDWIFRWKEKQSKEIGK